MSRSPKSMSRLHDCRDGEDILMSQHPKAPLSLEAFLDYFKDLKRPFLRHVPLELETNRYLLKTVDRYSEVLQSLRLRHRVFFELQLGKSLPQWLDWDRFDLDSDHLIVLEKATGQMVGNYRIRCSEFHSDFYSQTEFQLGQLFHEVSAPQVEIGRACISPDHRSGSVIQLLWRGLVQYMKRTGSQYLFGCSSVSTRTPGYVEWVWKQLHAQGAVDDRFGVAPSCPYGFSSLSSVQTVDFEMPALLQSYLRAGARVVGPPAYDAEFECVDFLTRLHLQELTEKRSKRFEVTLEESLVC
jgi:putative hemolysin